MKKKKVKGQVNITKERLHGTPFKTAAEMNTASDELRREAWNQLERARIKSELLKKEEYKFFLESFQRGMTCKYVNKDENLVKVYLGDNGLAVDINEDMKSSENSETLLNSLVRSSSNSLFSNYLRSMGIISEAENSLESEFDNLKKKTKR